MRLASDDAGDRAVNEANRLDLIAALSNEEGWIAGARFHVRRSCPLLLRLTGEERGTRR